MFKHSMFKTFRSFSLAIITIVLILLSFTRSWAIGIAQTAKPSSSLAQTSTIVARMWHGKTPVSKADDYAKYLSEAAMPKFRSINGNLGVQMLRRSDNDIAEFYVISYWKSRDAIRQFAGEDISKTRPMPRDPEFLIDPERQVRHFDVLENQWNQQARMGH